MQLPKYLRFTKDQMENSHPWLAILDISVDLGTTPKTYLPLYVVNNTENISFGTPPQEYTAYAFSIAMPSQSSEGELGKTSLIVYDVGKTLRTYIEDLDGAHGSTVRLRIINTEYLANDEYSTGLHDYDDLTFEFDLIDVTIVNESITIGLGAPNLMRQSFPPGRYVANHCEWYGRFKGIECKYTGAATCNGTKASCAVLGNSANFGGFPGLDESGSRIA